MRDEDTPVFAVCPRVITERIKLLVSNAVALEPRHVLEVPMRCFDKCGNVHMVHGERDVETGAERTDEFLVRISVRTADHMVDVDDTNRSKLELLMKRTYRSQQSNGVTATRDHGDNRRACPREKSPLVHAGRDALFDLVTGAVHIAHIGLIVAFSTSQSVATVRRMDSRTTSIRPASR